MVMKRALHLDEDDRMRSELLGATLVDLDFSFGEGMAIVLLGCIVLLLAIAAPIWRWW
jgi:hypothetical protein